MAPTLDKPLAAPTGNATIDKEHTEFELLLREVQQRSDAELADGLAEIRAHMAEHFEHELQIMRDSDFPATIVHRNEHQRVLAWFDSILIVHERGDIKLVRQFLDQDLPEWYVQHALTMDSATANWVETGELYI